MLNFLRNYQKIVFGIVTAALIVSISFFGSYNAFLNRPVKEKDFVLGTAIDGSSMSYQEIEKITRFISTDSMDVEIYDKMPNIFNDGILRKDFFESGLAAQLIRHYLEDLQGDLEERLEKQKRFKPYTHPDAPFLSAENLWAQFFPSLKENFSRVKNPDFKISKENVSTLVDLYVTSMQFPSHLLRRFMSYQENQYNWVKKDHYLQNGDLSLFYFHSLEDWFGKTFLNLAAQVIHNASIHAKSKGYKVSKEEAKADLLRNGYETLLAQKQDAEVSNELLMKYWQEQLSYLGVSENEAINIWEKVLLCRKFFNDYGHGIFLDRLCYDNFHEYASEYIDADIYSLPKQLHFQNFHKLMLFETYKELISKPNEKKHLTDVHVERLSLSEIQKKAPELIYKNYEIEYAHLPKQKLAALIGLKEMWDWQVQSENWKKLRIKFPELASGEDQESEKRFAILDKLDDQKRQEIDLFSRETMLESSQDLIEKALSDAETSTKTYKISLGHQAPLFEGLDNAVFTSLLDRAALKGQEEHLTDLAIDARKKLENYTEDKINFYKIYLLKKDSDVGLYSFDEAVSENILEPLLEKKLKNFYKQAKDERPSDFHNEDGSAKDFSLAKDLIGKVVFKPILKAIEEDYESIYGKKYEAHPLDFYAKNRFLYSFNEKLSNLKDNQFEESFFDAYHILKEHKTIYRKQVEDYIDSQAFLMKPSDYSDIKATKEGSLVFYQITEKTNQDVEKISKDVIEGQSFLAQDAKKHLMSDFLQMLNDTDSIHLGKFRAIKVKEI